MVTIHPLGKFVVLRPLKKETSVIDAPDPREKVWNRGEVVACGEEVTNLFPGAKVIFSPLDFEEVDSETYIIEGQYIWGILE